MPFGAYKLNAWGGNLSNAPVIPVGMSVKTYNQVLANITIANASNNNYNNQIAVLGIDNSKYYFAIGYGGSAISYTSLVTISMLTGATTISNTSSNTSQGNNEIAAWKSYANSINTNGLVVSTWNQGATPTEVRNNSLYIANWAINTAGTTYSGGNTTLGIMSCNYDKGKASVISYQQRQCGVSHLSGTNYIKTYTYNATAGFTLGLNLTNTNNWNIQNGLRLTNVEASGGTTNMNMLYVGYSSTNNLYIGSLNVVSTTSVNQSAIDSGIAYTNKNAMIKTIWQDSINNYYVAVIQHSDQFLRFVKCTAFGSSFNPTQSRDFLISDTPNSWYRVCDTGINGLGALVYYVPTSGSFFIKFFSIDTNISSIVWGDPIQLNVNGVGDMVLMNADVKWMVGGFMVGIVASDGVTNNQCYMSILYNTAQRPWVVDQGSIPATYYTNSWYATTTSPTLTTFVGKFGNTGLGFGSSNSYLRINGGSAVTNLYNIGTGNYTIEFWISGGSGFGVNGNIFTLFSLDNNNQIGVQNVSGTATWYFKWDSLGGVVSGQTYSGGHVAVVRESGVANFYVNGVRISQLSNTVNWNTGGYDFFVGNTQAVSTSMFFYMSEFRVSNIARYTGASFTVPTTRFCNDVNTIWLDHFEENFIYGRGGLIDDTGQSYIG